MAADAHDAAGTGTGTGTAGPRGEVRHRITLRASRRRLAWLVGTLTATLGLTALLLELWNADFSLPFNYGGDPALMLAYVKDVIEHSWYDTNAHLAAPFGAEFYDYPALAGDNLQLALMKLLSLASGNAPTVMNVFYVLTFPLDALTAYLVFERFGVSRPTAAACALLFAFIPFHFLRAETHLTYSAYYGIPIDAYLLLRTLGGHPLFARRAPPVAWWARWMSRRTLTTVLLCAIAGCANDYYAFFAILMIACGAPLAAFRTRRPAVLATGATVIALISATLVINYSPTLIYRAIHGVDPQTVQRAPVESELYSLRLIQLVLPNTLDRIPGIGAPDTYYNRNSAIPANESTTASLGIVGTIGFLWLLAVAGLGVLGFPQRDVPGRLTGRLTRDTALLTILALLIGTTGGIGALFSYLVNPDVRAYNRISPFIAFFALIGIAVLLDGLRRFAARRAWPAGAAPALILLILGVGIFEEAPRTASPPYAQTAAAYRSDDAFVHHIERAVGRSAAIFELPYERLPAVKPGEGAQYANIVGYLHSSTLRWSYGSLPGRPEDWQSSLVTRPLSLVLPSVVAAGFSGVQIDRPAYTPAQLAALLPAMGSLPGNHGFTSADGRYSFFDLGTYAQQLSRTLGPADLGLLRSATLHPLTVNYRAGFFAPDVPGPNNPRWAGRTATLEIDNPSSGPQTATYSGVLETGYPSPYNVRIQWPGGARSLVRVTAKGTSVSREIQFPPGASIIRFATDAPPAHDAPGDTRILNVNLSKSDLLTALDTRFLGPAAGALGSVDVLGPNGLLS